MKKKPRPTKAAKKPNQRERVTGIGGIFFKAKEPAALAAWYREHLGIDSNDGYADFPWREADRPDELGRTVWSLFPADSDYFQPGRQPFMINYRVSNLPRMLDQLRRQGVTVEKVENHDYGSFAWVMDPEGNRIELWQPPPSK
jgi:catechol 2,3-dioxygenase-like lactoylglutathione lyase family enzyme